MGRNRIPATVFIDHRKTSGGSPLRDDRPIPPTFSLTHPHFPARQLPRAVAPAGRPRHEPPSPCLERRYPESSGAGGVRAGVIGQRRHFELSDQTLELGQPLAEGGVLRLEPSDRGRGIDRARLPPAGDAAARGADPPARRPVTAAPQTPHRGPWAAYVRHPPHALGRGWGRVARALGRSARRPRTGAGPLEPAPNRPANCGHALARRRRTVLAHARWGPRQTRRSEGLLDCLSAALRPRGFQRGTMGTCDWNLKRQTQVLDVRRRHWSPPERFRALPAPMVLALWEYNPDSGRGPTPARARPR